MSDYASKKDMMLFENEILGDIKKLDNKINSKYDEKINDLTNKLEASEQKVLLLSDKIGELYEIIANQKDNQTKISQIINFKQKTEESMFVYDTKIHSIEKDLNNAIYKFDNIFSNILVPGLIGNACKYPTVRQFLDYCNKSFMDLNAFKDKQIIDLKAYKSKMESLVNSFQLQIENVQQKFIEHFNKKFVEVENKLLDRIKITDDRIDVLRVENLKYANELIEETKKLGIKWEKLDAFEIKINNKLDDEIEKFSTINDKTVKEFHEYQNEFKLLKQKFTVLSEFIKDVRFRKNLGQNVSLKEFKQIGNKIDFRKKQKLEVDNSKDELEMSQDMIKNKDLMDTFQIDDEEIPGTPMSSRLATRKRDVSNDVHNDKSYNESNHDKSFDGKDLNDKINNHKFDNEKNNLKSMFKKDNFDKDNKKDENFILNVIQVDENNEENKNEDNKKEKNIIEENLKKVSDQTQTQHEIPKTINLDISNYRNELKNINQNHVKKKRFSVIANPESFKNFELNINNNYNNNFRNINDNIINNINNDKVSETSKIKIPQSPKKNLTTLDYIEEKNFEIKDQKKSHIQNDNSQKFQSDDLLTIIPLTPKSSRKKRGSLFNNNNINNNNNNKNNVEILEKFNKKISDLTSQIEKNENHLYGLEAATSKKFDEVLEQIRNLLNNIQPHHKKKSIISNVFSNYDSLSLGNYNNFLMTTINFSKKNNFSNFTRSKKKINIKIDAEQKVDEKKGSSSNKDFSKINILSDTEPPYLKTDNSIETLNSIQPYLIKKFTEKK
jgi:hypothetical protein